MPYLSRNARNHRRRGHNVKKVIIGLLVVFLLAGCVTGAAGAAYVSDALKSLPNWKKADAFAAPQATRIYSADGKLLARVYLQNRESITEKQMCADVRHATVAVEDERFYQHGGIDPAGILRAAVTGTGGGSTLTQQYVRQTVLSGEATQQTLSRKVREAYLAMQVEKDYSKDEILTMYLNTVYYGEGAYGIQAAAQTYFAKNASDLTLPEAALLAGLPQLPSKLNPYLQGNATGASLTRRNHVLDRMLANNYITKKQHDDAVAAPIKLTRAAEPQNGIYAAPYFVQDVKYDLLHKNKSTDTTSIYGLTYEQLVSGGLVVKTSLDTKMQSEAEASVHNAIGNSGPEAALVTINPKNGWVQAMVGGRSYAANQINLANNIHSKTPGRQPGSTFKAFTLTTAIENGMSPSASVNGSAVKIPAENPQGYWDVQNSEGQSRGQISVAQATYSSVNGAYARIEMALGSVQTKSATSKQNVELGAEKVAAVAKKMGVVSLPLPANPSLTLGGDACTVQDIASGFATLANNGVYCPPVKIVSITDQDGKVLFDWKTESQKYGSPYASKRVLTPSVACAVTKILQGVVSGGTGTPARIPGRQIAGKTGTTNESTNLWFTGYTPNFCTSIWMGWRDNGAKTVRIHGGMGYGGPACGPIWKDYAKKVFATLPNENFPTAPAPPYNNSQFKFFGGTGDVPKVIGLDYQTANDKLRALGFTVSWIQVAADAPRGTIIAQSVKGNKVTLTVSLGGGSTPTTGTP